MAIIYIHLRHDLNLSWHPTLDLEGFTFDLEGFRLIWKDFDYRLCFAPRYEIVHQYAIMSLNLDAHPNLHCRIQCDASCFWIAWENWKTKRPFSIYFFPITISKCETFCFFSETFAFFRKSLFYLSLTFQNTNPIKFKMFFLNIQRLRLPVIKFFP